MKVVVIGAGFAGLAAAIALQERRHEVLLLERRGVLGGRATSFRDTQSGEDVDNGTHLMIGAYRSTLDLIRRAGAGDLLAEQDVLEIDYAEQGRRSRLRCPTLPAPWHLMWGLFGLRLPLSAFRQAARLAWRIRFGAEPVGLTLSEYLDRAGQGAAIRSRLWDPLATAILNETPARAGAVLFRNVFREAFLRRARDSRLVFLRRGYGVLFERLAAYFESRGGHLGRRRLVEALEVGEGRVSGVRCLRRPEGREAIRAGTASLPETVPAEAVVSAVPWHALPTLLPEGERDRPFFAGLAQLPASPIVSVEMWLDRVALDRALFGLVGGEVEWVFDKGRLFGRPGPPQHLSFVFSAAYRQVSRANAELVQAAEAALRRHFPDAMAGVSVLRSLVLREPMATFSCGPQTEGSRPGPRTPIAGLYLAGDWTDTGLPATIEGAVRSGFRAAACLEAGEQTAMTRRSA
jgi:hydroxysqualene dehydroxylase